MSPARLGVICAGLFAIPLTVGARAAVPRYDDTLPIGQVRTGMRGYGLTVFRGTRIEKFDVTVVSVIKKGSLLVPGHDLILVRMAGGPMTQRQAYLIRGMSGSPVYINGKIIGAFSQGEPTSKEPLGGVTPIEDMLEAWDPKLPQSPLARHPDNLPRIARLSAPIQAGGRRIDRIIYNVPLASGLRSHGGTVVMHPCTSFVTVGSLSHAAREKLAKALAPYNVEIQQSAAGGQQTDFKGAPLVPGAAFSMMLSTGDLSLPATGTVSYRRGNRMLGFGHPFMGIGPIEAPLCAAYIHDVYPLLAGSYKISSPGPIVGSSSQDRNFSISGVIGQIPRTIPVTVDVRDLSTGRSRVFRSQSVGHPNLYAAVVSSAVSAAIAEIRSTPGAAMARVVTTVDAEEVGRVTRTNVVFDARSLDSAATADLDDLLGIFTSNPFYPLGIRSAEVKVEIENGRQTAQVERVFLKEGRFEPGETAEVGIVIKPYKQPAVTRTLKIAIPQNVPTGRYLLQVRGGAVPAPISFGGLVIRSQGAQNPDQAPPANIRQMVTRYGEREKNNEIVARLVLPSMAVNVEGERLSNLPPSLDAIMRSAKSSGVRLERDEVRVVDPTEWVVSGQQILALNVQRRDVQEAPAAGPGNNNPAPTGPTSFSAGGPGGGDSDFSARGRSSDDLRAFGSASSAFGSAPGAFGAGPAAGLAPGAGEPEQDDAGADGKPAAAPEPRARKDTRNKKEPEPGPKAEPEPAAATPETPVGRTPQVWKQTTRADFAKGDPSGVSVTTRGDLILTRTLTRLCTSTESFVWCLIPDGKGGLYAGTGTQGRVLHIDATGNSTVFADLPEISVHSLLRTPDGALWAGTGPHGRTYRIAPDGAFRVAHEAPERYALALAADGKGNIYIGTGGGGNIYRVAPDGSASRFYHTGEEHVLSLTTDARGNLYAGTGSAGIVFRISPEGLASVLYDAPEQSITALQAGAGGDIYAVAAPRGVIYRISATGAATTVYDRAPAAFTALAMGPDETLYAASGNTVYAVRPDDTVTPMDNRTDIDLLALAVGADGIVYAGTGNVAEIYAARPRAAARNGAYESVVHDARQSAVWGAVRWTASVPGGTHLQIHTRTGNVADPDSTWSAWETPKPGPDGGRVASPPARFIQYRVTLESDTDASPALRDIAITYLPANQAPKVEFQAPAGGERWAGKQTVRWSAADPDKDTLSYELYYSTDEGKSWKPVPASAPEKTTETAPKPAEGGVAPMAVRAVRPQSVEELTAQLDKTPDLPHALREEILAQARKLNADYASGAVISPVLVGAPQPAGPAVPTRESSRAVDTKALPDGRYLLKVVASDRPSNPTDAQTVTSVSEPFMVCNASPAVFLLRSGVKIGSDGAVTLEGTASQALIAITAVQYRVDGGDWQAAIPADGIFDSATESFRLVTGALPKGTHTIEVKAFNAANTTATEKQTVEVK